MAHDIEQLLKNLKLEKEVDLLRTNQHYPERIKEWPK